MSSSANDGPQVPKRGEAAWRAERDSVAARNEKTQKAGRQSRETYERGRDKMLRTNEKKRRAEVRKKP